MGVIKPRDDHMHAEKHKHIEFAVTSIEEIYSVMEDIPAVNRGAIQEHLENGEIKRALDVARTHHDVYHFFQQH